MKDSLSLAVIVLAMGSALRAGSLVLIPSGQHEEDQMGLALTGQRES